MACVEIVIYFSMQENDKVSGALLSWHSAGTRLMRECVEIVLLQAKKRDTLRKNP